MAKEQTNEMTLDEQLKALELEERKQALESRKIQDKLNALLLGEKQQEYETKVNNKKRGIEDAARANADRKALQDRCNHHTGGEGAMAISQGQGDLERPTCIGAIQFLDDRIRLSCQRCGAACFSDTPNREEWAKWVNLWKRSVNKQMMVIGGLKQTRQVAISV